MSSLTLLRPRYALPSGPSIEAVETRFALGQEIWTQRAVARLDPRFARGAAGRGALIKTCRRLESAYRKVCAGSLLLDPPQGLTDDELADWAHYGEVYARAREPAFRVLLAQAPALAGGSRWATPGEAEPANLDWYGPVRAPAGP